MLGTALTLGGIGSAMDFGFDLLGGYLGGMMSTANSKELLKKQFKYQKELMKIQNDYNVYNFQHQHQWRTEDMRSAGLNPILSASGGSAVAPVSNPGVSSGSSSNSLSRNGGISHIMRDLIQLNSAKVASEVEYNKASALERASAAALNSARTKFEDVKGDTARDVHSFYQKLQSGGNALGKMAAQTILNSAIAERAINITGMPLDQKTFYEHFGKKFDRHKVSYDPEHKIFNFKVK